jgi:hypothetical protein
VRAVALPGLFRGDVGTGDALRRGATGAGNPPAALERAIWPPCAWDATTAHTRRTRRERIHVWR